LVLEEKKMSKAEIKDLLSKPRILVTEMGEIPIHKLGVKKKLELVELVENKDFKKAAYEILGYTLLKAFPEATEEQLDAIDDNILTKIMEEAMDYNGLKAEENPNQEAPQKK